MGKPVSGMTETDVYEVLSRILLSGCIAVRTKLGEHHLAELFGVSRERIRKVLHRLGHERTIELVPQRGAFTIDPGLEDARAVYEARRILEGGLIMNVAERMGPDDVDALEDLLRAEEAATVSGDWPRAITLAGDFHRMLARLTGNPLIERQLDELIARTSVLLTFFGSGAGSPCSCREHKVILDALRARDAVGAYHAMSAHLALLESRLRPRQQTPALDLETAIALALRERRRNPGASAPKRVR